MNSEPKVGVVGAGAIGGVTAAFVAQAGYDVELVCKNAETVTRVGQEGLHVFGVRGEHNIKLRAVAEIEELSEPKDVVLLATKATDMAEAATRLLPHLKPSSLVVSMQNGICEEALAAVVGRERTVGCVVGWGATMAGAGRLEMTSGGEFVIGNIDGRPDPRLAPVKKMLDAVVPTTVSEHIFSALYSKLIINSCITSLGALCGLYLGEMLSRRKVRAIFVAIIREAMAVAEAMHLEVEPYGGKLDYYGFLRGGRALASLRRHLLIRFIGFKYRRLKSSSLQSLERGRRTEIDFLNGYICSKGRELGVATPVNDRVVELIKEIETGRRQLSPGNFEDPVFRTV